LNSYQSTTPYNVKTVEEDEIRELFAPGVDLGVGQVSEVITDEGRDYRLKKVGQSGSETSFVAPAVDIAADPVTTADEKANQADDFSFFAQEDGFKAEAERRGFELQEGLATKGTNFISGIGQSQQIMNYLTQAGEGDVSDPLELPGQFVVLSVTEIT